MSNELALQELVGGLSTQSADTLRELDAMSQSTSFLQRIQLYSKSKSDQQGTIIEAGHFGIPKSGSRDIKDLGKSIDILPLARKAKALDMRDLDNIIEVNDVKHPEFQRIVDMADNVKDSSCNYGPTYLVYERTTKNFYEFFCGTVSARRTSSDINLFLPVTEVMIAEGLAPEGEEEPRFAKPLTLRAKYVESRDKKWNWFAPEAEECLQPIEISNLKALKAELDRFHEIKTPQVEAVEEDERASKRRR